MIQRISDFIGQHQLLSKKGLYLVALSGGSDSVCLLTVLHEMGYNVEAVHCNFNLRGKESERDERFCKQLCDEMGVSFHLVHFDTIAYATLHHVSIEMAARELRYSYFERLRNDIGADDICVGHHRDDSVETVLMNLIRGTGLRGLSGIAPRNEHIVRPLLCVSHDEIIHFLKERNQPFVTDSSNLKDDVLRNKIRLNVIPLLEGINPSVNESITKTAYRVSESMRLVDDSLRKAEKEIMRDNVIDIGKLFQFPSPELMLYTLLKPHGFQPAQIEQLFHRISKDDDRTLTGKIWQSPTHELLYDRGRMFISPVRQRPRVLRIPETGTYIFGDSQKLIVETGEIDDSFVIDKQPSTAVLDLSKVTFPLTLRLIERGDRFVPFGMTGSKLVSDFLTDLKLSSFEKRDQWCVTQATGEIIWLVGRRPDNRFRVTKATKRVLTLKTKAGR